MTDLDPSDAFNRDIKGLVLKSSGRDEVTLTWVSVPKIIDMDTNTFAVTLRRDGQILTRWGLGRTMDRDRRTTVVGISSGTGPSGAIRADLSRMQQAPARGTTYEVFGGFGTRPIEPFLPVFDLSFRALVFRPN